MVHLLWELLAVKGKRYFCDDWVSQPAQEVFIHTPLPDFGVFAHALHVARKIEADVLEGRK